MDSFYIREYTLRLRKTELEEVYIQVLDDLTPELTEYVRTIIDLDFTDGSYHTYFGHIKHYVTGFINFWYNTIDEAIKKADTIGNITDKDHFIDLIQNTIGLQHTKHINFGKEILPVKSNEQDMYDGIENKYTEYVMELKNMMAGVDKILSIHFDVETVKEQMRKSVRRMYEIFEFTHTYLAMYLADQLDKIKVSLEEIPRRIKHNYERLTSERDGALNSLMIQLYDKNKQKMNINRKDRASVTEIAEIRKTIDNLIFSIEDRCQNPKPSVLNLEREMKYWDKKVHEFDRLYNTLKKLKEDLNYVCAEEKVYDGRRTTEFPDSSKKRDWDNIGINYKERKVALSGLILENAKALMSFFGMKGVIHMLYTDSVGPYYRDHYGHQVYWLQHGLHEYHVGDDEDRRWFKVGGFNNGTIKDKVPYNQLYYYDFTGRHILEDGAPLYQRGRCASFYKLDAQRTLVRVRAAPGQREPQPGLPEICEPEPVEVQKTLDPGAAAYLWSSFGPTLPEALADVVTARPKNPFHYLAHRLLRIKCTRSNKETEQKAADNEKYRSDILQKRKDKAIVESKAYRSQLAYRRKPEESDDREDWHLYDSVQLAAQEWMLQLDSGILAD